MRRKAFCYAHVALVRPLQQTLISFPIYPASNQENHQAACTLPVNNLSVGTFHFKCCSGNGARTHGLQIMSLASYRLLYPAL